MRIVFFIIFFYSCNLLANTTLGENSGKPLPRFISLKSSEANLRIGPSKDYKKVLIYLKRLFEDIKSIITVK